MFYAQIIDSNTAEIQWQYNCHRNTELLTATIRVNNGDNLIAVINKNKAAWLCRTLEQYLRTVSRVLILQATTSKPNWSIDKDKPTSVLIPAEECAEWKEKWAKRRQLRILLTSFVAGGKNLPLMIRELHKEIPNINALLPPIRSLHGKDLKNMSDELCAWIEGEYYSATEARSVWTQ